jgi:hypothetical protein
MPEDGYRCFHTRCCQAILPFRLCAGDYSDGYSGARI